jgi:hypothetical protein
MDSENISATCFVPLQKSLIENATMAKMYCHAYPLVYTLPSQWTLRVSTTATDSANSR